MKSASTNTKSARAKKPKNSSNHIVAPGVGTNLWLPDRANGSLFLDTIQVIDDRQDAALHDRFARSWWRIDIVVGKS